MRGVQTQEDATTYVLAADGLDDILGRGAEQLRNDGELVDV